MVQIYIPTRDEVVKVMNIMEKTARKNGGDLLDASIPAMIYLQSKTKSKPQERFTIMSVVMHLFEISKFASNMGKLKK